MTSLTKENFQNEVLGPKEPVLIGFWANGNETCELQLQMLRELDQDSNNIKVCTVQVDEEPTIALNYGVLDIPALVIMDKGLFVKKISGVVEKNVVLDEINKLI